MLQMPIKQGVQGKQVDAISHLDVGFMRQPLPGMDQLELLEE